MSILGSNRRIWVSGLVMLCLVSGCGVLPEETTRLDVAFDRSGSLVRDSLFFPITATPGILIGDSRNDPVCGFVSINLNSIPAGALVSRVVLNLRATIVPTTNPFADFGAITVDHVNVVDGIVASDYVGRTLTANVGTIAAFPETAAQDVAIDVTSAVNADLAAGRPISSFRFRFDAAPSADEEADGVVIEASVDDPERRPFAVVTTIRPQA